LGISLEAGIIVVYTQRIVCVYSATPNTIHTKMTIINNDEGQFPEEDYDAEKKHSWNILKCIIRTI